MQEALSYKTWLPIPQQAFRSRSSIPNTIFEGTKATKDGGSDRESTAAAAEAGDLKNMVSENAVIVFGRRGCCMSHVVKRLLQGLGVNPAVHEVEEDDESVVVSELETIAGCGGEEADGRLQFPTVFIGGKLFGGLDRIMATHITGELIPILKQAGALWL
ncbi:Glutaredoxin-C9 [Sarracenia purpurea var. burkii]